MRRPLGPENLHWTFPETALPHSSLLRKYLPPEAQRGEEGSKGA